MLRRHRVRFALCVLACAITVACGNDSGSSASPEATNSAPGGNTDAPGASGRSPMGSAGAPTGEAAPGESSNAGLDNAPGSGENAGAPASGGASGEAVAMGGSTAIGAAGTASTGGAPAASPFPSSVTRPKIMIVGDSISAGPGCFKKYLLADLNSNGFSSFDFVGEYTDDCGGGVRHSAVSCSTAEQFTQPTFTLGSNCNNLGPFPGMATLMTTHQPDLVMIQLGVNDAWNGQSVDAILGNYATLVQQARAQNPNVVVAVAQIQQIRPTTGGDPVFARAQELITAVPAWAQGQSQPQSPVFVADLWTNSDTAQTSDGVHPDDAGAQRMGLNWFNALRNILPPD